MAMKFFVFISKYTKVGSDQSGDDKHQPMQRFDLKIILIQGSEHSNKMYMEYIYIFKKLKLKHVFFNLFLKNTSENKKQTQHNYLL